MPYVSAYYIGIHCTVSTNSYPSIPICITIDRRTSTACDYLPNTRAISRNDGAQRSSFRRENATITITDSELHINYFARYGSRLLADYKTCRHGKKFAYTLN